MTTTVSDKRMANALNEQLLPNDVINQILERVPVRSLLRFKCVSKYWSTLIKCPYFIKSHLHNQKRGRSVLLLWRFVKNKKGAFYFYDMESSAELDANICIPFMKGYLDFFPGGNAYFLKGIHILGSCNGLICIVFEGYVSLWNPALKEYKEIPKCPVVYGNCFVFLRMVFSTTSTGDYKVVLLWVFKRIHENEYDVQFHVYNLSTNSWTRIDSHPKIMPLDHQGSVVAFNGLCHWHSFAYYDYSCYTLISLDISTETLKHLEYPTEVRNYESEFCLIVSNECLGFAVLDSEKLLEVWVMKEYGVTESWTKTFVTGHYSSIRPLMSDDECLLALDMANDKLVSCAFNKKEIKSIDINVFPGNILAVTYKESLISLDELIKSMPMIKVSSRIFD